MRKVIRIVALVLCFTFILSMGAFVSAFTVQALNVTLEQQEESWWCWAACSLACIKYYYPNHSLTQSTLVIYVKGQYIDEGGNKDEIRSALAYGGINSCYQEGDVFIGAIQTEVDQGRPSIIITENNTTSYGHTFLAHGYEIGNNSRYIGYKDPADGDITYAFDVKSMSGSGDSFVVNNEDNTKYISRAIIKNIAA